MYAKALIKAVCVTAIALTALVGCDTPSRPALEFSPTVLPDARVGSAYAATIVVSQAVTPVGGASVQDGALPEGLDMALAKEPANTIQISGKPKVAGTFTFTVSVWCYGTNVSGQMATQQYVLVVVK
jgi:hypothetical protein